MVFGLIFLQLSFVVLLIVFGKVPRYIIHKWDEGGWENYIMLIWWGNICLSLFMMPMTLATFMDILDIWSFHVMFWSSVNPKKLKLVTCSTGLPLIEILSFGIVRGCLKNIMNFDLAILKRSILLSSQVFTFDISLFHFCSKVLISFTGLRNAINKNVEK